LTCQCWIMTAPPVAGSFGSPRSWGFPEGPKHRPETAFGKSGWEKRRKARRTPNVARRRAARGTSRGLHLASFNIGRPFCDFHSLGRWFGGWSNLGLRLSGPRTTGTIVPAGLMAPGSPYMRAFAWEDLAKRKSTRQASGARAKPVGGGSTTESHNSGNLGGYLKRIKGNP